MKSQKFHNAEETSLRDEKAKAPTKKAGKGSRRGQRLIDTEGTEAGGVTLISFSIQP